jgi:hypothetical protein
MNDVGLQIAITLIRDKLPCDLSLEERLSFAMRYARENERDLFWMFGNTTDEMRLRAAIAAVMVGGTDEEKDLITESLKPLKMLSAAMSGVPVDFSALDGMPDNIIPIMELWNESA